MIFLKQRENFKFLLFLTLTTLFLKNLGFAQSTSPKECPKGFRESLLNGKKGETFLITQSCILNLKTTDTISSNIEIEGSSASNFKLDCNKATIGSNENFVHLYVQSKRIQKSEKEVFWSRPENVSIENCTIYGNIRVKGLGGNGEDENVRKSSKNIGHTERAQNAAPKNITIKNCSITTNGTTTIYFAPGVTYSSILDSKTSGSTGPGSSVYLDAESAYNTIARNTFSVESSWREQIAIDGSAYNLIQENYIFSKKYPGGIFIYRNCGLKGTIRHQKPINNQIINNFFQSKYEYEPIIYIGSRHQSSNWCDDDEYPVLGFGSSGDDRDYAQNEIIKGNLFFNRDPKNWYSIAIGSLSDSAIITDNKSVNEIPRTLPPPQTPITPANAPVPVDVSILPFSCSANTNTGCRGNIPECPKGTSLTGIKAACNLETPEPINTLDKLAWNKLKVERASDVVSDGHCKINNTDISSGEKTLIPSEFSLGGKTFFCKENDNFSEGECSIKGSLMCSPSPLASPTNTSPSKQTPSTPANTPDHVDVSILPFSCSANTNTGCRGNIPECPKGTSLTGIKAACNLETPEPINTLDKLAWNKLKVERASDVVSDGHCKINNTDISSGEKTLIPSEFSLGGKTFFCKENDNFSEGECSIKGSLMCSPSN